MTSEELIELVNKTVRRKSEEQTLEVKAAHVNCPKRLYDTLSSFSNQDSGGILLFGLDEKQEFKVVGVYDPHDLQKKVTEQCNQMEPKVRAFFTIAEVDGLFVCSAEIPGLDLADRPCYYMGAGRIKGSYIRVGDADLNMTDYELYSYEAFRKHLHDDERPISRASFSSLKQDLVQQYVLERRTERPGFSHLDEKEQLEMLNIVRDGVPTLAAVMNFGIYPQGYLPQLGITAVVVPGKEIGDTAKEDSSRFLDNKRIEGTIAEMVEEALAFCRRNMKSRTIIDKKTGQRIDKTEYPLIALREAILNALIHRDYSNYTEGTPVQINFFSDRLEIHSPGGLYGHMTVEQLGHTKPDLRNPALAVMAEILTDAENRYSGIPTMRREMALNGLPEPVFENRRGEFVVTFYNSYEAVEIDNDENDHDLLAYCSIPRTRKEIAAFLGVKTATYAIRKYVMPLVEAGKMKMSNPDKPGSPSQTYYKV